MTQFVNPADLKKMSNEAELAKQKEAVALKRNVEQAAEELKKAFETRELAPETPERINQAIRRAAEQGQNEVLVLRFPAALTKDGGRRINNFEADWPDSLTGFSKTAYEFYLKELEPMGFTLRAEIMSFPGGMLGDVGMYLKW